MTDKLYFTICFKAKKKVCELYKLVSVLHMAFIFEIYFKR